jgi:hypothetical protein
MYNGQMYHGQMSISTNFFLGKCMMGKCPSGYMSFWANVSWANGLWAKYCSGQVSLGKCFWAIVSEQMFLSSEQMLFHLRKHATAIKAKWQEKATHNKKQMSTCLSA